jgi:hypothetical protein
MSEKKQATKKDRHHIPVLDRPIEELKKKAERTVDFSALMSRIVEHDVRKGKKI